MTTLPKHLDKYIVSQSDRPYTPRDHAVWRYILRQLKNFLGSKAHPFYIEGLQKTGITVESIPQIRDISQKLEKFHWQAKPVSGFIPPAAFMEMQALSVLPIASDMRSIDQLLYTPAPDIVHEAAGHAPMLAHPEYAEYLKEYAEVAKHAIISKEDLDVYEAIRILSDTKSNPQSTPEEIEAANNRLQKTAKKISFISEATYLSRMNWWTAEYGLIGNLENPQIYGAGLLSSVGEARWCLSEKVKKVPFNLNCINYNYDITEPQPQLFVTPDFKTLSDVLKEFSQMMAYKQGGFEGLEKAARAQTVNTVVLNSGLQISGQVVEYIKDRNQSLAFLRLSGPCQLSLQNRQLANHSPDYHSKGYSTPIGTLKQFPNNCPSELSQEDWKKLGVNFDQKTNVKLEFTSGFQVTGQLVSTMTNEGRTLLLTLEKARAEFEGRVLFEPSWGLYDIALGTKVVSVFGGPADRESFGTTDTFVVSKIPAPHYSDKELKIFAYYQILRDVRDGKKTLYDLDSCIPAMENDFPDEWLLFLEGLEISLHAQNKRIESACRNHLERIKAPEATQQCIREGISLAHKLYI